MENVWKVLVTENILRHTIFFIWNFMTYDGIVNLYQKTQVKTWGFL